MEPLDNMNPALLRAWHPVALSSDLTHEPQRVVLAGHAWVLARAGDTLLAFDDRCPHRGAPLSQGKMVDGCLQCPYHGWKFATDGQCVSIPATGDTAAIPARAHRATPAGLIERYGIVWLAPEAPLVDLIDFPEWGSTELRSVTGGVTEWHAGAAQMVDNFLDVAHFPFTHLATFGVADDLTVQPYSTERDGWTVHVDHHHVALAANPADPDPEPRHQSFVYVAPFSVVLRLHYGRSGDEIAILFAIQPVDAVTSRLYRWNLRNTLAASRQAPGDRDRLDALVIHEDRDLLQRFASKAMPLDLADELHTKADRATIELRRVLSDFVVAASPAGALRSPEETVMPPSQMPPLEPPAPFAGIHHIAICVDDLDAALAFYTGVLDLEQIWRPDTLPNPGAWLQIGAQQIHLLSGDDRAPTTFQHFAIAVDDLRATRDRLREHGVELEGHQVIDEYGLQAFIRDPSGNVVEFYHQQWPMPAEVLSDFGLGSSVTIGAGS